MGDGCWCVGGAAGAGRPVAVARRRGDDGERTGPRRARHVRPIFLLLVLALIGCTSSTPAEPGAPATPSPTHRPPGEGSLVILYTSDIHGLYDARPSNGKAVEGAPLFGGFVAAESRIRAIRAEGKPVLLLDAGDLMTGHPICQVPYSGVEGGALMAMMNAVGYDVWCLGNHEFDQGISHLYAFLKLAKFPTIGANIAFPADAPKNLITPSTIIERGGIRIGIVGLMTEKLPRLIDTQANKGVVVSPIVEAARREIARLDPDTDLIILLTHEGFDEDKALAAQVPGADIIIGGHSHTPVNTPAVIGGVIVCQDQAHLRMLGRLDVTVKDDKVVRHDGRLLDLPAAGATANPDLDRIVTEITAGLSASLKEVIGVAKSGLHRAYYGESPLGDYVADVLRKAADADVALMNSGGLRKDLEAGHITIQDMQEILGFQNHLCVFEATGAEIAAIAQHNAEAAATEDHGVLQVSGLSYRWSRDGKKVATRDVKVGGKPVDRERKYRVAASDYVLISQPEKYLGFVPDNGEDLQDVVTEVVIRAIRAAKGTEGVHGWGRIVEDK